MNKHQEISLTLINRETIRYLINGIICTFIHYSFLYFSIEILNIYSAGISNFFASIIGIFFSFLGNRYYVYKNTESSIFFQLKKFLPLYYFLSVLHGGIMYLWSDIYNYSYGFGFCICTLIQVVVGYCGGKHFVFKRK